MIKKYSWHNSKLVSKKIGEIGDGVFAEKGIKKGEILAVFGGYIISLSDEKKFPAKYRDSGIQISENLVMSSLDRKEITDCFNHSCEPNSGIKGQIFLVAMRNIKTEEQVTFDYAMCLSNNKKEKFFYKTKCLCGSKKCRVFITGDDWKIPELQKKYSGYFQWYLQEKIDRIKKIKNGL